MASLLKLKILSRNGSFLSNVTLGPPLGTFNVADEIRTESYFSESVEEIPKRRAVSHCMVNRASNEDSVSQLGELYGHDRLVMSLITNRLIKGEKLINQVKNMNRSNHVTNEPGVAFSMKEVDSDVVA
ncbi:hypothetical protein V6N13_092153 [Hibiscus sabdariffa]|uniref:Uncharacterized protein n=1 Tax=Hibiscus sabdariffa TaxID=183260 RepID=A0ABR2QG08_9ROSI